MTYHVEIDNRAVRVLVRLPKAAVAAIREAIIGGLQHDPRLPGCKKLTGKEGYRIRTGDYRILYEILDPVACVRIYKIGHRKDVYR